MTSLAFIHHTTSTHIYIFCLVPGGLAWVGKRIGRQPLALHVALANTVSKVSSSDLEEEKPKTQVFDIFV